MKITVNEEARKFQEVLEETVGSVTAVDPVKKETYDLQDPWQRREALMHIEHDGLMDRMELFASRREDEMILLDFVSWLAFFRKNGFSDGEAATA